MKKNKKELDIKENLKDLGKKSNGFLSEFKKFIARGNVMDLAVGVIVGTAFTSIVTSLSNNILLPLIGIVIGGFNFKELSLEFTAWGNPVTLNYGLFIQSTVDFLITAFCVFVIVKVLNNLFSKKEKKEEPKAPVKSDEVKLLEEIRDLLKESNK
ncbi:MAG: large-conductance mechanosensitive channel protein MscL [Candidatus Coprovivens sp.]